MGTVCTANEVVKGHKRFSGHNHIAPPRGRSKVPQALFIDATTRKAQNEFVAVSITNTQ